VSGFSLEHGMLSLIRALSTQQSARLAFRFSNRLYPEWHGAGRRLRFYLRSLLSLGPSSIWFALLNDNPGYRQCLRHEPEMAEKLHRPYRRAGLRANERLGLALDHARICERLGWTELIARAYGETVEIARLVDRDSHPFRILLARPGQFGKEGELALHFSDDDVRLYSACFSFRESGGVLELDVGCIQGPGLDDGPQRIRELTRGMHGLRPKSLILESLRAVALATGCSRLRVVGNANHIYRSLRKRRHIAFDYDAFCQEAGGATANGADWLLPVRSEARPLSEIPSRKRSETARRRALLEALGGQIRASVPGPARTDA
jgi:uncharacterized protein VirK/YbjX